MLEMARLVGTPPEGIILQTRARNYLANSQSCEPDDRTRNLYGRFRSPHIDWKNRKPACGVYNCFGLVWANRRTSIYSENDLLKILTDDGYRPIINEKDLQPGDIVIYLRRTAGNSRDTLHVAKVLNLDRVGSITVPWLLSKWSDQYGEDIHKLRDVPTYYGNYLIELWTDRP
ncbi:MAG: hypothetical protein Q7O12_15415 [Deltaproteobacteria bacterium]|nr:hypothetical protein [Deltaproteobacteria bacterium]